MLFIIFEDYFFTFFFAEIYSILLYLNTCSAILCCSFLVSMTGSWRIMWKSRNYVKAGNIWHMNNFINSVFAVYVKEALWNCI